MIQRIQTLYLILTSLVLGLGLFFYPNRLFYTYTEVNVYDHPTLFLMLTLTVVGPLAVVFLYKKRQLQFVLNRLLILLVLTFWILHVIGYIKLDSGAIGQVVPMVSYLLSIFLLVLANKAIKRDQDLVRAADRIR